MNKLSIDVTNEVLFTAPNGIQTIESKSDSIFNGTIVFYEPFSDEVLINLRGIARWFGNSHSTVQASVERINKKLGQKITLKNAKILTQYGLKLGQLFNIRDCSLICDELANNPRVKAATRKRAKEILRMTAAIGFEFLGRSVVTPETIPNKVEQLRKYVNSISVDELHNEQKVLGHTIYQQYNNGELTTTNLLSHLVNFSQITDKSLQAVRQLQDANKEVTDYADTLEAKIEQDKPKVEFAEAVDKSKLGYSVNEAAKFLLNKGNRTLYKYMRELGFMIGNSTQPKQAFIERGYFVYSINKDGFPYTIVTAKGLTWLRNQLAKAGYINNAA